MGSVVSVGWVGLFTGFVLGILVSVHGVGTSRLLCVLSWLGWPVFGTGTDRAATQVKLGAPTTTTTDVREVVERVPHI